MNTNTIIGWIVIVLVVAGAFYLLMRQKSSSSDDSYGRINTESGVAGLSTSHSPLSSSPTTMPEISVPFDPVSETVRATLKTSKGDIVMELYGKDAPLAVGNFVSLTKQGFYKGVTFHRVIPGFMIQTGDPVSKDPALRARHGTGGPEYQFPNEVNDRKFVRGAIGMANSGLNTNGSQFFIMVSDYPSLDGGYTNFGTVVSGMEVADAIVKVDKDENDNPFDSIVVQEVVIEDTP